MTPEQTARDVAAKLTTATCAHYDDGTSDPENGVVLTRPGTCLFGERSWREGCKPKRYADCPAILEGDTP